MQSVRKTIIAIIIMITIVINYIIIVMIIIMLIIMTGEQRRRPKRVVCGAHHPRLGR
jgi:hypothetical protein